MENNLKMGRIFYCDRQQCFCKKPFYSVYLRHATQQDKIFTHTPTWGKMVAVGKMSTPILSVTILSSCGKTAVIYVLAKIL